MRPAANDSLYRELDLQEGIYEYNLPEKFAVRPLTYHDLDKVIALEEKAFPPNERGTREKLEYRLKICPELCAGVVMREFEWPLEDESEYDRTVDDMNIVVAKRHTLKSERLVGHIIATKTNTKCVTDESMGIGGHVEDGDTIAIHSLVVDPEFQGKHIGHIMLKDYVQKFFALCNAERISLLAHQDIGRGYYAKHGFKDEGISKCEFGGVKWHDFILPFDTYDDQAEYYQD